MPDEDVSDLRDVVDAINRLCDNMKTSSYDDNDAYEPENETEVVVTSIHSHSRAVETPQYSECRHVDLVDPGEISVQEVETHRSESWSTVNETVESPERWNDVPIHKVEEAKWPEAAPKAESANEFAPIQKVESYSSERWSDTSSVQKVESYSENSSIQKAESYSAERWSDSTSQISLPGQVEDVETDTEPAAAQCEPVSEMYYTASSEVSLLSDLEGPEKATEEVPDDRQEVVAIAGHVAAMRERFESMTRANTPCPDLVRSVSPTTLDWRNVTPSPDHLGG